MKIHADASTEDVQIQILPLIDVIFCILTFFILAALQLTRQQAISVDLPKASTGVVQMREMLVVTVNATGQTFVDKQPVDRSQLYQVLQSYQQNNPNGLLVLNASQTAFYNDVVQVLDLMRSVGGDRVALATIPAEQNSAATNNPTLNPGVPTSPNLPQNLDPGLFQLPPASGPNPGSTVIPGQSSGANTVPGQNPGSPSTNAVPGQNPGSSGTSVAPAPNPAQ